MSSILDALEVGIGLELLSHPLVRVAVLDHLVEFQILVYLLGVVDNADDGLADEGLVVLGGGVDAEEEEADVCALVVVDDPADFVVADFVEGGEVGGVVADEGAEFADGVAQDGVEFAAQGHRREAVPVLREHLAEVALYVCDRLVVAVRTDQLHLVTVVPHPVQSAHLVQLPHSLLQRLSFHPVTLADHMRETALLLLLGDRVPAVLFGVVLGRGGRGFVQGFAHQLVKPTHFLFGDVYVHQPVLPADYVQERLALLQREFFAALQQNRVQRFFAEFDYEGSHPLVAL